MIWGIDYATFFIVCYFVIAIFVAGTWWEIEPGDDIEDLLDIAVPSMLWGIFVIFAVGFGVLWTVSWVPRGPARFVIWLRNRPRVSMPRAKVV